MSPGENHDIGRELDNAIDGRAKGRGDVGFPLIDAAGSQPLILPVTEMQIGEMNQAHAAMGKSSARNLTLVLRSRVHVLRDSRLHVHRDAPLASGGSDCVEFKTMLNHDSVSQPRFWSTSIVPLTMPFSRIRARTPSLVRRRLHLAAHRDERPVAAVRQRIEPERDVQLARELRAELRAGRQRHLANPAFADLDRALRETSPA